MKTRYISPHMQRKKYKTFVLAASAFVLEAKTAKIASALDKKFVLKSNEGILYLLYKRSTLYYVGKSSQQGWRRMLIHRKNRHKNKWDRFLILKVKRKYLTTLESLVIDLARPSGNKAFTAIAVRRQLIE
ncbi:MAG: hypothetical protein AABY53_01065 [Bdellovibrionota bacterium]